MKRLLLALPLVFMFFGVGCATVPSISRDSASAGKGPLKIIDAHVHFTFHEAKDAEEKGEAEIPLTREQLKKEMQEAGVVGLVSHTADGEQGYSKPGDFKVVQCAGIREFTARNFVEAGLKSKKFSCIKIYLGYVHKWASDPYYRTYYEMARRYKVPVVFHTGDTYSKKGKLKYADPLTVDEIAVDYPDVTFVIAHCGNPWLPSAAEVAYKNDNVYLDGSALMIGDLSRVSAEDAERYMIAPLRWLHGYIENPKKLMFGSDWPLTRIGPYVEIFKKAIPAQDWDDVFYRNAQRVFRVPGLPNE